MSEFGRQPRQATWLVPDCLALTLLVVLCLMASAPPNQPRPAAQQVIPVTSTGSALVWQALIAACVTITLAAFQVYTQVTIARIGREAKAEVREAKVEVQGVKETLASRGDLTDRKLDVLHDLGNGVLGGQMRLTWMALQGKAAASGLSTDQTAADEAKRIYVEHETAHHPGQHIIEV